MGICSHATSRLSLAAFQHAAGLCCPCSASYSAFAAPRSTSWAAASPARSRHPARRARLKPGDQVSAISAPHGRLRRIRVHARRGHAGPEVGYHDAQEARPCPTARSWRRACTRADVRPGQKVLINGASGGIGSAAVQLLPSTTAQKMTGVCGAARLEYVEGFGGRITSSTTPGRISPATASATT